MIHEVMCLDYCGVDLAWIKIATWLKSAALSMLAADAVAAAVCPRWWFAAPLAVLLTGLSVGIVESTQARNKSRPQHHLHPHHHGAGRPGLLHGLPAPT